MTPGRPTQLCRTIVDRLVRPVVRIAFRPTISGLEHLPTDRPFMLVGNHSAGLALAELASLAVQWQHHRSETALAGFAHPSAFRFWPISWLLKQVGAVPATYDAAHETLGQEVSLLVFPGGDHDSFRPVWRAKEVDFNGRLGFLKIARTAEVPIVPMGITGSHYTAPVVWRSKLLPYLLVLPALLGVRRWGLSLGAILFALACATAAVLTPLPAWAAGLAAWFVATTPLAFLPWIPATIRFRLGPAVDVSEGEFEEALALVEARIQGLVKSRGDR